MDELARRLTERCGAENVRRNEPMSAHTTFRVGGPADLCCFPGTEEETAFAISEAGKLGVPVFAMGNGSNLIVRDGGVRGLVVILGERMAGVERAGTHVRACAGASLAKVAAFAQENALTGLEFAGGIPGSVGGGAAMNAGAYGGQMSDVFHSARVLKDGAIRAYTKDDMEMRYRSTKPLREGSIVLSVDLALKDGEKCAIRACMNELNARRREKQPLEFPSAGSTFKRPEGHFAGALIDEAGLRGYRIGGATVSEKHAGFIINAGGATARDILALIECVRAKVSEKCGVTLEPEVRIVGED